MQQVFVDSDNNNSVRKIQFLSESEGFVAFDKWIGYSKDSGRTFTRKFVTTSNVNYNGYGVNLTFGFAIKGVYAFSNSWLLVYGHYGFVPAILSSTDGGNSFTLVYQADTNPAYLYRGVLDMFFSGYTGYAVTDDRVLKTTNRGLSWATVCVNNNADFLHLNFFDGVKGIAVAQSKILKTLNGGSSWQSISTPLDYIRSASFLNDQKGWLSIGGLIYRTTTGGNSWEKMNNEDAPVAGTVLRFQNDSIGYTNGDTYTLLKTTDGGKYWQKLRRTNRFSYLGYIHESLFFLNHNQYWAGGGHGFLELTTNGGGESVPVAAFVIDYSDLSTTNTVRLLNKSKPGSAFTWYRNQTILSTSYDAAYVSNREGVGYDPANCPRH
jgi:photosystem II stability/assembly factor-like uncharacterized protein